MDHKRKAAFIKFGSFSHVNEKVLEILNSSFPGVDIHVIDILASLGIRRDPGVLFEAVKGYWMDIILGRKKISNVLLKTPYAFAKIRRMFLDRYADQNYVFTFQTQSLYDSSIPGIPHFLYTDHSHLANLHYPGFSERDLFKRSWIELETRTYQNATLNFTMSSNISSSLIEDYSCNPERVTCVYCGANIRVAEDENFGDERYARKNILFVGMNWNRKGGPTLAKAFETVLAGYPDATLTIVGCRPDVNLPNCNVVGRIPLRDVKQYFAQASVFCLPTTLEPFGIVFLEAMAHKLPIIGTNIGAQPDFVVEGKNGFLVNPGDSHQLAQKIITLIGSPDKCKALGEYGHRLFWDTYTWEKTGRRLRENMVRFLA
jgi:glycosyltransferase involved in cell wall biosynthesis